MTAAPLPLTSYDRDTLIRTVWGEARGETEAGQVAVVHVVRNRVRRRGTSAGVECRRPWQFSCWLPFDPNAAKLRGLAVEDPAYLRLGRVVDRAWLQPDTTSGATHYFARQGMAGARNPAWAKPPAREVLAIGHHSFWSGVA